MAFFVSRGELGGALGGRRTLVGTLVIVVVVLVGLGYTPNQVYQFLILLAAFAAGGLSLL